MAVDDVLITFIFNSEAVLTINEIRIAETSARTLAPSQKWLLAVSSGKRIIEEDCTAREIPKMTFGPLLGLGRAGVA